MTIMFQLCLLLGTGIIVIVPSRSSKNTSPLTRLSISSLPFHFSLKLKLLAGEEDCYTFLTPHVAPPLIIEDPLWQVPPYMGLISMGVYSILPYYDFRRCDLVSPDSDSPFGEQLGAVRSYVLQGPWYIAKCFQIYVAISILAALTTLVACAVVERDGVNVNMNTMGNAYLTPLRPSARFRKVLL
ncbi:hypothetical protein FB451DRAFT_1178746 [Mycena latifolia]|nr:hypothetical protein FB451DRAFT_1178746 [Mycena latifolia]